MIPIIVLEVRTIKVKRQSKTALRTATGTKNAIDAHRDGKTNWKSGLRVGDRGDLLDTGKNLDKQLKNIVHGNLGPVQQHRRTAVGVSALDLLEDRIPGSGNKLSKLSAKLKRWRRREEAWKDMAVAKAAEARTNKDE